LFCKTSWKIYLGVHTVNLALGLFYAHREIGSYKCALLKTFAECAFYQNVKYCWQWKIYLASKKGIYKKIKTMA